MNTLYAVIVVVQVLSALIVIGLVLLQHGKGADMGATFGAGASGSLFGAAGSSNFLSKSTAIAASVFFVSTLALAFWGGRQSTSAGVMERFSNKPPAASAPAALPGAAPSVPAASVPASSAAPAPVANPNEVPK